MTFDTKYFLKSHHIYIYHLSCLPLKMRYSFNASRIYKCLTRIKCLHFNSFQCRIRLFYTLVCITRRRSFDKPRSRLRMTITVGGKNQYQLFVIAMRHFTYWLMYIRTLVLLKLVSHWHANFSRLFCEFCRGIFARHSCECRASVVRIFCVAN